MANIPNFPSFVTNNDLPTEQFPTLSRTVNPDLVAPQAADRQSKALEKRDVTIVQWLNYIITFCNNIATTLGVTFLRIDGGNNMLANLKVGDGTTNYKIINQAPGTAVTDGVNLGQVALLNGSQNFSADIHGVATTGGSTSTTLATKSYVDSSVASIHNELPTTFVGPFTSSSTFTVPANIYSVWAYIKGGGGGGGGGATSKIGGNGASGGTAFARFAVTPGTVVTYTVGGGGGGGGSQGGSTYAGGGGGGGGATTVTASGISLIAGGGGGGSGGGTSPENGGAGGAGGAAGTVSTSGAAAGTAGSGGTTNGGTGGSTAVGSVNGNAGSSPTGYTVSGATTLVNPYVYQEVSITSYGVGGIGAVATSGGSSVPGTSGSSGAVVIFY